MDFYLSNEKVLAQCYTCVETEKKNRNPSLPKRMDGGVQSIGPKANANKIKIKSAILIVLFSILMLFCSSIALSLALQFGPFSLHQIIVSGDQMSLFLGCYVPMGFLPFHI